MGLQFHKMHGLGNDFVIVDGREQLVDNARIRVAAESGDHAAATHSGQRKTLDRLPRQEAR